MVNKDNASEITISQKTSVKIDGKSQCYAIRKNDWDYLKQLIINCKESLNWLEIITSALLSTGISFIISFYTTNSSPSIFAYLGYGATIGGILGVAVCLYL